MNKIEIRKEILNVRNNLTKETLNDFNEDIFNTIIKSDIYKKAQSIFIYISFGSEVETKKIIEHAISLGKNIYVPKTNKSIKEMIAVKIHNFDNMTVDKWGILEPITVDKNFVGNEFDLIIMPGVAFDITGNRIGYGGGYYDKYIHNLKRRPTLLALAYEFQIIDNIIAEIHDIKLDYIITEKKSYRI